ncbi:MAG TPA: SDR family oxidoreductase [Gemmatimonadales bacterium]|nr:SDR family oxidoreductase [Gemmatimonadales bacterium]
MSETPRQGAMVPPLAGLAGARVLVTGGSRGIGRAAALLFAACGARVAITWATRSDAAEEVVNDARALGAECIAIGGDLAEAAAGERAVAETVQAFGGLDCFVGNHGIWPVSDVPLTEMPYEQWRRTMDVNLDSMFHVTQHAARALADNGRIVLVTSTAAQRGEAGHGDYAASKGALVSLVKGLCVELAPRGITVNSVAPGWVDTDLSAAVLRTEQLERAAASIPLRRVATAEDIAGPVVFLCTPMARHITGEIMNVNGGSVLCG